jgi:hypothetical protein
MIAENGPALNREKYPLVLSDILQVERGIDHPKFRKIELLTSKEANLSGLRA